MENKIKQIKKRDGRIVDFDQEKITIAIHKAFRAKREEDGKIAKRISDKVVKELNKKFAEEIPGVEDIQDIVIETLRRGGFKDVVRAYSLYRKKRQQIREAKYWLLNHDIKTYLAPNAFKVLESRYLRKNEYGKIVETPQQLFQRVAQNIAAAEKIYNPKISDDDLFRIEEKFYRMMASLDFLPNSPTLMNAGGTLQQLSACFVVPIDDSMTSIFEAVKQTALIHKSGGGTGFSFSRLRPEGDMVGSTHGVSSGPISFMTVFDQATAVTRQGGRRRGANMGILRIDHPDILKFVTAKREEGILSNFNISVAVTNSFMDAARKDKKYDLINPRTGQSVKKLKAREVFDLIIRLAWENGEPGIIFIDRINNEKGNPTPKLGRIEATNPCSELPLLPYESCNLASINVSHMLKKKNKKYEVDWQKLKKTVLDGVRFLDNVIDMNRYPIPEIEAMTKGNRRIGLGIMGWADMLIMLETPYNSRKALDLAGKIMEFIDREAKRKSQELTKERGVFPNFKGSVYDRPGGMRLRNCALTTIAPTGSISIIAGCSSAIEPLFALAYTRLSHIGHKHEEWTELIEINSLFEKIAKERGFYGKKLMKKVAEQGSCRGLKEVPEKYQKIFVTAHDLTPEEHVRMQAAFQKYIDNSISKTINFPESATVEDVKKAYMLAYDLGCKGITVYRSESRKQQVLNIRSRVKELLPKPLRPKEEKAREGEVPPQLRDPSPQIPEVNSGVCPTCSV